jgi:hypothetical protein
VLNVPEPANVITPFEYVPPVDAFGVYVVVPPVLFINVNKLLDCVVDVIDKGKP